MFFADSAGLPRPSIDRSKPLKAASFSLYFDDHPFYTLSSLPFGNSYRLEYVLSFHAGLLAMSARDQIFDLKQRISAAVIGQEAVVDQLLIALFANGHLLMEGLPGLAKTRTIKTLARNLESEFRRIQFTPDLLRYYRYGDLHGRRCGGNFSVPTRAGLRKSHSSRRDQPCAGQSASCSPRGDGGTAGDGRWQDPPAARSLSRARHPESNRIGGHLSFTRSSDGSVSFTCLRGLFQRRK